MAYSMSGEWQSALISFNKALEINDTDAGLISQMAIAYAKYGMVWHGMVWH